jgi:hypothetical protein
MGLPEAERGGPGGGGMGLPELEVGGPPGASVVDVSPLSMAPAASPAWADRAGWVSSPPASAAGSTVGSGSGVGLCAGGAFGGAGDGVGFATGADGRVGSTSGAGGRGRPVAGLEETTLCEPESTSGRASWTPFPSAADGADSATGVSAATASTGLFARTSGRASPAMGSLRAAGFSLSAVPSAGPASVGDSGSATTG